MHFKNLLLTGLAPVVLGQDLMTALSNHPSLSNLTTYLQLYPSIMSQLGGMSNITLLAPSNMAFSAALNSSTGSAFQANDTDTIAALLSYHVLEGSYSNFSAMPSFVPTSLMPGMYANVSNGQVVEAIASSNMTNATVTFYSGLLQNSSVVANGTANFTGGVIHIIDHFLNLPSNITDTAVQLNLRSAVGALQVANLASAIDMLEDVTCFIPNNEAFQAIGATLATATPEMLTRILEYHVVNGTVGYSTTLMNGTTLTSYNGLDMTITIADDEDGNEAIFVNSARVLTPNVLVGNGVVHVIDGVLNPGNRTARADTTASTQMPAFTGASSASGTPFTSGVPTATTSVNTQGPASQASQASAGASSSSSGIAVPMKTGAVGAAALFGGAAAFLNM